MTLLMVDFQKTDIFLERAYWKWAFLNTICMIFWFIYLFIFMIFQIDLNLRHWVKISLHLLYSLWNYQQNSLGTIFLPPHPSKIGLIKIVHKVLVHKDFRNFLGPCLLYHVQGKRTESCRFYKRKNFSFYFLLIWQL